MTHFCVVLALFSSTFDLKLKSNNGEVEVPAFSFYLRVFTSTSDELCRICNLFYTFHLGLFHQRKILPIKTVDSEVCGLSRVTGALFLEGHAAVEFHECCFSML